MTGMSEPKAPMTRGRRALLAHPFQFSPPDPLRVGEGRPAAMTPPAQQLGGGGRLNLSNRSRQREHHGLPGR
jgi:hypothetical protein